MAKSRRPDVWMLRDVATNHKVFASHVRFEGVQGLSKEVLGPGVQGWMVFVDVEIQWDEEPGQTAVLVPQQ